MDISELRTLAASGNSEAQYHLYMQLRSQSSDEARDWLKKSVDNGFPPALYESGAAKLAADSPNVQRGLKQIEEAAEAGFAAADYHLACLKVHAYGCDQDLDSAKIHLMRAARAGDPNALYAAAMMFARSDQDAAPENAFILYQSAAPQAIHWLLNQRPGGWLEVSEPLSNQVRQSSGWTWPGVPDFQ